MRYKDLKGKRFGKLKVLEECEKPKDDKCKASCRKYWKCLCDCGNVVVKNAHNIQKSKNANCGCISIQDKYMKEGTLLTFIKNKKPSKANKTGKKGVCWEKRSKKYRAYINSSGTRIELGMYVSLEEAIKVREKAEKKYHDTIIERYKGE